MDRTLLNSTLGEIEKILNVNWKNLTQIKLILKKPDEKPWQKWPGVEIYFTNGVSYFKTFTVTKIGQGETSVFNSEENTLPPENTGSDSKYNYEGFSIDKDKYPDYNFIYYLKTGYSVNVDPDKSEALYPIFMEFIKNLAKTVQPMQPQSGAGANKWKKTSEKCDYNNRKRCLWAKKLKNGKIKYAIRSVKNKVESFTTIKR